jgi:integrase
VRVRLGERYVKRSIATADDIAPANSNEVLSYAEAIQRARDWSPDEENNGQLQLTVADAVDRYLDWYKGHRKSFGRVRNLFKVHVLPELGDKHVDALTPIQLRRWHQGVAAKPARLRGGQERPAITEEAQRARRASANHALTALKAALNRAVEDGLCEPGAWTRVKPFQGVDTARARYLETEEIERLLNSCECDFRELVSAALHTGARYGELAALRVGDYMPEAQAVHLPKTKGGQPRHVYLSEEAVAFFDRLTAGRSSSEHLLTKADGSAWGRNHQYRPMLSACEAAEINPPVGFHQLRHSYASLYLMSGGSLVSLARQLGHSTTRMVEKHYAHLADTWRAEEARKHAPRLGREKKTVVRKRRRKGE